MHTLPWIGAQQVGNAGTPCHTCVCTYTCAHTQHWHTTQFKLYTTSHTSQSTTENNYWVPPHVNTALTKPPQTPPLHSVAHNTHTHTPHTHTPHTHTPHTHTHTHTHTHCMEHYINHHHIQPPNSASCKMCSFVRMYAHCLVRSWCILHYSELVQEKHHQCKL